MRYLQVLSILLIFLLLACEENEPTTVKESGLFLEEPESNQLNAFPIFGYTLVESEKAPLINGLSDDLIWQAAPAYEIKTSNGKNGFAPTATMKALYDNWYIYFLIAWDDTSDDLKKMIFEQNDEDGFAIMWNQNSSDFISCQNLCHTSSSMATDVTEFVDVWIWGANHSNSLGYLDDKYLSHEGFNDDKVNGKTDVMVQGSYENGVWTLEIKRNLTTKVVPDCTDVEFYPDANANVEFHVAVFNNSQGQDHAISTDVNILHFLQLKK